MPEIRIHRAHALGLAPARRLARQWAQSAQQDLHLACRYEEGALSDRVSFSRAGVEGELRVTPDSFELEARLGFLLGAFRDRIEREIGRNLDELLGATAAGPGPAAKAGVPAPARARTPRPASVPGAAPARSALDRKPAPRKKT